MGRKVAHMSTVYRETISDERLKAVNDHVRHWLFQGAPEPTEARNAPLRGSRQRLRRSGRSNRKP
jgi:hypothetical protein